MGLSAIALLLAGGRQARKAGSPEMA